MRAGMETRITRVYQQYDIKRVGGEKRYYGPYWFGYFQENGKQNRVYIGKELPESLKYLIDGRVKKPGYKTYTWPWLKR